MERKALFGRGSSLLISSPALVLFGAGVLLALRLGSGGVAGVCLFFLLLGLAALVVLGVWLRDTSRTRILDCSDKKPVPRYRPFLLITSTRPPFSACPSVAVISAS